MKYINAADILPEELLKEIQVYVKGDLLYVPSEDGQIRWGEKSGSRAYYLNRNKEIKRRYQDGSTLAELSDLYGLAFDTLKRILYS